MVGRVRHSHHLLGCAADIIAGNRADHRRLYLLIQKMQQEGKIRFTQLIWSGAKGTSPATAETDPDSRREKQDVSSPKGTAMNSDGRWIHISYVPGDLRCEIIDKI